ncbi:MAG: hypothetical protein ABJD07_01895 [Gemmatimonadaceae bacterium]
MPLLWLGTITFLSGAALAWFTPRASSLRRLGGGIGTLGLGTLAMTQPGLVWIALSIVCSTIAIVVIGRFVWEMRRGR